MGLPETRSAVMPMSGYVLYWIVTLVGRCSLALWPEDAWEDFDGRETFKVECVRDCAIVGGRAIGNRFRSIAWLGWKQAGSRTARRAY
jgi:hypothetical protein